MPHTNAVRRTAGCRLTTLPCALPCRSALLYAAEEYASRQLSLSGPLLGPAATAALPLRYLGPQPSLVDDGSSDQAPTAAVTHWVVADVSARQGLSLVAAALQHRSGSGRVGLLLNSAAAAAGQELTPIEQLLAGVASGQLEAGTLAVGGGAGRGLWLGWGVRRLPC